jgi:hypothetical protein
LVNGEEFLANIFLTIWEVERKPWPTFHSPFGKWRGNPAAFPSPFGKWRGNLGQHLPHDEI